MTLEQVQEFRKKLIAAISDIDGVTAADAIESEPHVIGVELKDETVFVEITPA